MDTAWDSLLTIPLGDRYQLQQQLGKRVGRQTVLAVDRQTQQQVVIKLLFLGQDFEWQDLKLFEREAETLQQLDHPAIPRYLDYLDLDLPNRKGFALVQSYVSGKSLEQHLKAGRSFSETDVRELAKSLLEILSYLHNQTPPVIHRDIKPSNIILGDRTGNSIGQVYLVDFGSVQHLAAHKGGTITVVGTYGYMPPEQFGGRTAPASDLYGLGATLIYLVTGHHPNELPQQEFRIQFRDAASLKPDFANWLEQMTEPSLDRRFSSADAALQALEHPQPRKLHRKSLIKRPPQTEIILNQSANAFEAILPPSGISWGSIALLCFSIPLWMWVVILLDATGRALTLAAFVSPLAVVVTITFLLRLLHNFARHRLVIGSKTVTLTLKWFGLTVWRRSYYRSEIDRVIVHMKAWAIDPMGMLRFIESADPDHLLFYLHVPTESEAEWLAAELNHWLDVPLERQKRDLF